VPRLEAVLQLLSSKLLIGAKDRKRHGGGQRDRLALAILVALDRTLRSTRPSLPALSPSSPRAKPPSSNVYWRKSRRARRQTTSLTNQPTVWAPVRGTLERHLKPRRCAVLSHHPPAAAKVQAWVRCMPFQSTFTFDNLAPSLELVC